MPEDEKILESMLKESGNAPEPGELKQSQVLEKGNEGTAPTVTKEIKSAGYVYIYDTLTGEQSLCNRNMLLQHLKKTRPDGSTVFTLNKPKTTPKLGTFKCILHPDDSRRGQFDAMGLPTCRKSNMTSKYQVTRHMQKRHKVEWATIEADRLETEKQADKEFQKQMMDRLTKKGA